MSIMRLTFGDISAVLAVGAVVTLPVVLGGAAGAEVQGVPATAQPGDVVEMHPLEPGPRRGAPPELGAVPERAAGKQGPRPAPGVARLGAFPHIAAKPSRRRAAVPTKQASVASPPAPDKKSPELSTPSEVAGAGSAPSSPARAQRPAPPAPQPPPTVVTPPPLPPIVLPPPPLDLSEIPPLPPLPPLPQPSLEPPKLLGP